MNQILHILRKDTRQFWKEIAVSLVLLAVYVWKTPRQWSPDATILNDAAPWPVGLLLLGGLFLVVRVIQAEPLVGTSQFWITRPYRWQRLLAEKVLFLAVFIFVPLLVAGLFLLAKGGFGVATHLGGLLATKLSLLILLAPIVALCTLTKNVTQWVLSMLAVVLYTVGMHEFAPRLSSSRFYAVEEIPSTIQLAVFMAAILAIIFVQYAKRRTTYSLLIAAAAAILIPAITIATPYRKLAERKYPLPPAGPQLSLHAALDPVKKPLQTQRRGGASKAFISIPIQVSGISSETMAKVDGALLSIEAPDGTRWQSEWQSSFVMLFPRTGLVWQQFEIDKAVLDRAKSSPAKINVSFAVTEFRNGESQTVIARDGEFSVPGVGQCWLDQGRWLLQSGTSGIRCRYAISTPKHLALRVSSEEMGCPAEKERSAPPQLTSYWWTDAVEAGPLSPVDTLEIYLSGWVENIETKAVPKLCQGAQLTFSTPEMTRRGRVQMDVDGVRLADYEVQKPD